VDEALATLQENGATGIILDLRGNGGGWVTSAQGVLGRFLDPEVGPAMFEDISPGRGGEEPLPILGDEGNVRTDLPVIVLVDPGTASASEIVAGALKDYDRAIVVGERTYGKGSVQRIFGFSDGASLRVTVAEWFTPSRGRIQQEGIQPNVEIPLGAHPESDGDPALDAAVKLMQDATTRPTDLIAAPPSPVASPEATAAS
jgi:carboxyl-terminal processing protease